MPQQQVSTERLTPASSPHRRARAVRCSSAGPRAFPCTVPAGYLDPGPPPNPGYTLRQGLHHTAQLPTL